jgi:hypothetical protein
MRTTVKLKHVFSDIPVDSVTRVRVGDADTPVADTAVYLEASKANTADVFVGLLDVTSTKKLLTLTPGRGVEISTSSDLWVIAASGTQTVYGGVL